MNEVKKNANMSKEIRDNQDKNKIKWVVKVEDPSDSNTNEKKWDFAAFKKTNKSSFKAIINWTGSQRSEPSSVGDVVLLRL